MNSKTIILSSSTDNGRAILTLYKEDELLKCKIRLYNLNKLTRFCKLGVYHNEEVFSANLLEKDGVYHSSMVGNFDIDKDFYTAIIDTANNNNVILSGGTYAGYFFNDERVFEKKFDRIEKENPNTNLFNYDEEDIAKINNNQIQMNCDEKFDCERCKTCKYKEFFYSQNNLNEEKTNATESFACSHGNNNNTLHNVNQDVNNLLLQPSEANLKNTLNSETNCLARNSRENDNIYNFTQQNSKNYNNIQGLNIEQKNKQEISNQTNNENEVKDEKTNILTALIPQFKYVFENYPEDNVLNSLIPNSKFVTINENDNKYSIGAIYENEEMKYICYAVMCNYNTPAPSELGEHYQWLPLDKEDPLSEGYFIVFQDAHDLKIVEL